MVSILVGLDKNGNRTENLEDANIVFENVYDDDGEFVSSTIHRAIGKFSPPDRIIFPVEEG